jgi:hypothetical protein
MASANIGTTHPPPPLINKDFFSEKTFALPGELLEGLALPQLCPLFDERFLELGPALEHLSLLGLDVLTGVVVGLDQLIGKGLQSLDLLLKLKRDRL